MTRTILATATALLAATMFLAPAAEACISCEYAPEVVQAHSKPRAPIAYESQRALMASKAMAARLAKERAAKAQVAAKKLEAARAASAETKKAAPAETTKTAAVETQPVQESKTVSTASPVAAEAAPAGETKVAQDVGCKKFISAIGMTVTVPCE